MIYDMKTDLLRTTALEISNLAGQTALFDCRITCLLSVLVSTSRYAS